MPMLLLHVTSFKFILNYCRKFFLSSSSSSSSPIQCSSDRGEKGRRGRRWRSKCWSYYRNPWNWTSILLVKRATQKIHFYLYDLYRISIKYIVVLCLSFSFKIISYISIVYIILYTLVLVIVYALFSIVIMLSHAPIVY